MRRLGRIVGVIALVGYALAVLTLWNARQDPVVRQTYVALSGWPAGAKPLKLLLVSDFHVSDPDMPPDRLAQLVRDFNALGADAILLGGDYVSDKSYHFHRYSMDEALAPLAGLKAPLGVFAVLGNHDHHRPAGARDAAAAFARMHIQLLNNRFVDLGPVKLAGLDDIMTFHENARFLKPLHGDSKPVVVLSHSPDVADDVRGKTDLLLAGHTHCGQIVLPVVGALEISSRFGNRYRCGLHREPSLIELTTAGIGTTLLPMRLGAPPDVWLVTLGP